jgi:Transposase, Mutator family
LHAEALFQAVPELAGALAHLTAAKFAKMVAFLRSPVGTRVRTNNHVERMNRRWRHYEKVRYRWPQARAVVRFVVLVVARLWRSRREPGNPQLFDPGAGAEREAAGVDVPGSVPEGPPSLRETNAA